MSEHGIDNYEYLIEYVTNEWSFIEERQAIANKYNVTESSLRAMLKEVLDNYNVRSKFDPEW